MSAEVIDPTTGEVTAVPVADLRLGEPVRSMAVRRALMQAQRAVKSVAKGDTADVKKDGKTIYKYAFASSEDMVTACREALLDADLSWELISWEVVEPLPKSSNPTLVGHFELFHGESGEYEARDYPMPIASRNDADKALAGAITYLLGQSLRALLMVPRVSEEDSKNDPDRREERGVGWGGDGPRASERRITKAKEQIPDLPEKPADDFSPTGETTDHLKLTCTRLVAELRTYMRGMSAQLFRADAGIPQSGQLTAADLRTYKHWLERKLADEKLKARGADDMPDWAGGPTEPGTVGDGLDQREEHERVKPLGKETPPSERFAYPHGGGR